MFIVGEKLVYGTHVFCFGFIDSQRIQGFKSNVDLVRILIDIKSWIEKKSNIIGIKE